MFDEIGDRGFAQEMGTQQSAFAIGPKKFLAMREGADAALRLADFSRRKGGVGPRAEGKLMCQRVIAYPMAGGMGVPHERGGRGTLQLVSDDEERGPGACAFENIQHAVGHAGRRAIVERERRLLRRRHGDFLGPVGGAVIDS
jgi:hypothetical protein